MDAITMLREDHREVERLFKEFEQATKTGARGGDPRAIVDTIVEELSRHAAVEEQAFYPAIRAVVPDAEDTLLESLEEHHVVKTTLAELEGMDPSDERFKAKVTVLIESVRHHVEEEEGELFPKVREVLGRKTLQELAQTMAEAKEAAPTRPQPDAPDTPPGNLTRATADVTRRALQAVGIDGGATGTRRKATTR